MELITTFKLSKKEREYIRYALEFTLANDLIQSDTMNEQRAGLENLLWDINRIGDENYQNRTCNLSDHIKKNFRNGRFRFLRKWSLVLPI